VILRRALILAAGVLAGAALLAPATASSAPVPAGSGVLTLTPGSGSTADNPVASYRTAAPCPADHRASARVYLYGSDGRPVAALSEAFIPTATAPSGRLDINSLGPSLGGRPSGDYQVVLGCFDAGPRSTAFPDITWVHIDVAAGTWRVTTRPVPKPSSSNPAPHPTQPSPSTSSAPPPTPAGGTPPPANPRPTANRSARVASDADFTFSVSATAVAMLDASPDGPFLRSTGVLNPVTVTDQRTGAPGWSVVAQVTDFSGTGTTIDGSSLGWSPSIASGGTGVTLGPSVAPGTDPGLSGSAVLATATAGQGAGTTELGAGLTLRAPSGTPSGRYAATLTLTAMEAPI